MKVRCAFAGAGLAIGMMAVGAAPALADLTDPTYPPTDVQPNQETVAPEVEGAVTRPAAANSNASLALTGAEITMAAGLGTVVVAGGVLLVIASRRARPTP